MTVSAPAPGPDPDAAFSKSTLVPAALKAATLIPAARLAEKLGIAIRTLDNWVRDKHLPQPLKIRGRRYFRTADLQHLLSR
jgi:hypothetical protein